MIDENNATVSLTVSETSPTRNQWKELDLGRFLPDEIRKILELVRKFNNTLADILDATKKGLEIAKALAALASQDPLEAALREALKQIEDYIDALLEDTTAHALFIPIQKNYYGVGDPIPPSEKDPTEIVPSYNRLLATDAYPMAVIKANTPDTVSFINTSATATGGNAGYYRVLVSSIYDEGDLARPNFPNNFAVTGVSIIFGSSSLTDIYRIIALINRLLKLSLYTDLSNRSAPFPKDLKARVYPFPTSGRIGVQLDWEPVPPILIKPLFGAKSIITEIFVVRSTSPQLREAFAWSKVFPEEPSDDPNDLPSTATTKVIARISNDGFIARYVDAEGDLKMSTPYFYAIALRYKVDDIYQPMSDFSNVVRVLYMQQPYTSRNSIAPDWFATPSVVQLFPIIQDIFSYIKLYIESALTRTTSNNGIVNVIEQTIQQIEVLLQQAEEIAQRLKELEDLLRALSTSSSNGLYATSFNVKTGGIEGWTSELARRMSNRSDSSRPPFDHGELVAGMVFVAGAPNLPDLSRVQKIFDFFFGPGSGNKQRAALDDLNDIVRGRNLGLQEKKVVFNEDMSSERVLPTVSIPPDPKRLSKQNPVFNTNMTPAPRLDDC